MQKELRGALLCLCGLAAGCSGSGGGGSIGGDDPIGGNGAENLPPSISGTPPDVANVGEFYSFTPTARDPEGHALTFTIKYKPPWASFRASDGRLSGTPGPGQVGSHIDITISASDGETTAALPAFTIDVFGRGSGSAELSWYPPTENEDGSALTDLAGYRIYFGRHKRHLDNVIVLDNPGLTRYLVEGLTRSHWYFAMTSVNRDGTESRRSEVVRKKVR